MSQRLMKARLVYDGGTDNPLIPSEMGAPKKGQFEGTPRDRNAELCGRICYGSLGSGRTSVAYHEHIHDVKNHSVYEHTPITVLFALESESDLLPFVLAVMNRPGVFIRVVPGPAVRITANQRAVLEWGQTVNGYTPDLQKIEAKIGISLQHHHHEVAPLIVHATEDQILASSVVSPSHGHEKWVTIYMGGSRGFSHEQVRHGDATAISQRSTRYVDESSSPWVLHPLINSYLEDQGTGDDDPMKKKLDSAMAEAKGAYDTVVGTLQPWLLDRMPGDKESMGNKTGARKQARGAARGFLGNALFTEMLFSGSVQQWKWMLFMRASFFADAEIREVYAREDESVLSALRDSKYASEFEHLKISPAEDGIGDVVTGHEFK